MWDSHCHLTIEPALEYSAQILKLSRDRAIKLSVCAVELDDYIALKSFKQSYPENIYHIGLHPWAIKEDTNIVEATKLIIEELGHFDGVGEVGLDFLKSKSTKNLQISFLEKLLFELKASSKPVVYHCVKAHNELLSLDLVDSYNIIHGFYGSLELAKRYLDRGFYFSLGHLYLNSKKDDLLGYIPIDRMLLETDSPSHLYKEQTSSALPFRSPMDIDSIYRYFSSVMNISKEELILELNKNMNLLYKKS